MNEHAVTMFAVIALLSITCQWLAWRSKLPAILFLLIAGLLIGPTFHWLNPTELFGSLLFPFVSLSVALILFEGSLTLRFDEIREQGHTVTKLVTLGLVTTWLITTVLTHWILDFSWSLSALFGAIMVVTGPTVIIPLLRAIRLKPSIANILRWEGIIIDPLGALLAVLVFEFIVSSDPNGRLVDTLWSFGQLIVVGGVGGVVGGYTLGRVLREHWLPDYLYNVATLSWVFVFFVGANTLQPESGLLAVTIMGMWLANMRGVPVEHILDFKESLSVLLISGLFIILAARVEFSQLAALGWHGFLLLLGLQFIARPAKVFLSTLGSNLSFAERGMLAWIGPRGIVAAAITAVFALRLQNDGYEQAELLVPLSFFIIIGTVLIQSATARIIADKLGVSEPDPKGFLIIGANPLARAVATALVDNGYTAILTDSSWENISAARMSGLRTYYGNPVSEHADRYLDLVGIARVLALSVNPELNALVCLRYSREFGKDAVYSLRPSTDAQVAEKHVVASHQDWRPLFSSDATYATLSNLLARGDQIKKTTLTENFNQEAFNARHGANGVVLFAINPKGILSIVSGDVPPKAGIGWT